MEWGHLARPPVLLDVSPRLYQELAMCRQHYYLSTHNAGKHNTIVVVWNLYCDRNSDWQVSCGRNLRRFKQINDNDIYTAQLLAINSINIGAF